jgi:hypothetical protein
MFGEQMNEFDTAYARVVRATTVLAGSDPTGVVESASIVLVAPVEPAAITLVNYDRFSIHSPNASTEIDSVSADTTTDMEDGTISKGNSVLCLCLKTRYEGMDKFMLVLVAVDGRPGVYRRVGMKADSAQFVDGWFKEELEVEII